MAYVDQARRPSPGGMLAVAGVHVAMATALVMGLTVTGVITPPDGPISTWDVKDPPPPPPPKPTVEPSANPTDTRVFTPIPPLPLPPRNREIETTIVLPPPSPPTPQPGPAVLPNPGPSIAPGPAFTPVAAKPRNDPGRWLTEADYRTSWINRELTGRARFRLEIAANGRVAGCAITGSTGHSELDDATCALVARRARFEPARGSEGEPVAGSYSGSVSWRLPE